MQVNEKDFTFKVSAAGRINIIGEHIDYCGGKVFPAALSLKNTVYVRPNGTNKINLAWTTLPNKVTLDIDDLLSAKSLKYGNYQAGSAYFWKEAGHKVLGCDMIQDCTVPFGSGLSSSAAIEVSTIAALCAIAGEEIDPVEIAKVSQKAEREFAGVNCGIMDQYASACGKKNHAMLLDCKTITCEYVPIDLKDYSFVIINSKKPHALGESKYNERREETELGLEIMKKHVNIDCLAELTLDDFNKYGSELPGKVYDRVKHVVMECGRVHEAEEAMKSGDLVKLGKLLTESHNSLSKLYEVTGVELDTLARLGQEQPSCLGSRMIGGGFGGCTISIVKTSEVEAFKKAVCEEYKKEIGYDAECYSSDIADGIIVEKL